MNIKKLIVALPGGGGGFGKWFGNFFVKIGCTVLPIEKNTPADQIQSSIEKADIVFFSVPTLEAPEIIGTVIPFSKPHQLWMDITTLKENPLKAMMKSRAEVVGLHPMCAPPRGGTLKGKNMVVCVGRLNVWQKWFSEFLSQLESANEVMDPCTHDQAVMRKLGIPHAQTFVAAVVLRHLGVDFAEALVHGSPFCKLHLAAICRMHSQKSQVYSGVQIGNPYMLEGLELLEKELQSLIRIVKEKNIIEFDAIFEANKNFIGDEALKLGFKKFEATMV